MAVKDVKTVPHIGFSFTMQIMRSTKHESVRPTVWQFVKSSMSTGMQTVGMVLLGICLTTCSPATSYGPQSGNRIISQSVSDPDFRFSEKMTIGFIPIYFHDWYRRPAAMISEQQKEALFPDEVINLREEPIFWSPGDKSRGFSELQEKQMYGYFKQAMAPRGYTVSYLPLERPSLHGSGTSAALNRIGMSNQPVTLEDIDLTQRFLPDTVGDPNDNRWQMFTVPLSPDKVVADSIVVRYRAGQLPDLIMQAWFFQQGADVLRPDANSTSGANLVTRKKQRPDVYAQGVWLQVWAQPPHYRVNVWSGAILRSSTKPDIFLQAKGMIAQLLAREDFPRGLIAQPAKK